MQRRSLIFTAPGQVEIREEALPAAQSGQVLVETRLSAISPGTELLIYRGQAPANLAADETIPSLVGNLTFPLKYGYSTVGQVVAAGSEAGRGWLDRWVFSFHPHESHFWAAAEELLPLPGDMAPETALFLPNMETAVNFMLDGRPLIGEVVVLFGQGIVGLLTTALLARLPLAALVTLDSYPQRRAASLFLGAALSLDPLQDGIGARLQQVIDREGMLPGADLVYELSGNPAALAQAIACAGFSGRVVIGSWYGQKRVELDLGGRFHRSRIHLMSSQVSSLTPELAGRWTKARRLQTAWQMLAAVQPAQLITQRFPLSQAPQAYALLDKAPGEALQVILTYEGG